MDVWAAVVAGEGMTLVVHYYSEMRRSCAHGHGSSPLVSDDEVRISSVPVLLVT